MNVPRLLICTDLDRTLIANGRQEESPGARARFDALVSRPEITLVYVTGRHLELVREASIEHVLPSPEFIIADVGTSIYHRDLQGEWTQLDAWQLEIGRDWNGQPAEELHAVLNELAELQLQEESKQNRYKLSYYFSTSLDADALADQVRKRLADAGVNARIIYGNDEMRNIGLLDVVPECASKLHALQSLMELQDVTEEQVIFSGDSGNDLEVLVSSIPAVLVANAAEEIKTRARRMAGKKGNDNRLYIATGGFMAMNGCYSAGILEGIAHYHPATIDWMKQPSTTTTRSAPGSP